MSKKELARDDLIGRNADHTFTETVDGSMTLVEFKDSEGGLVAHAQTLDVEDAYTQIRENLGLSGLLEILTSTELAAITPKDGTAAFNVTTMAQTVYVRGAWR